MKKLLSILQLIRVKQWIKNIVIFIPLFFSGELFQPHRLLLSVLSFLLFCCASSIVYVFNDVHDIEADKLHEKKKFRPLPSGTISIPFAFLIFGFLVIIGILLSICLASFVQTPKTFFMVLILYLALNFFYSLGGKNITLLELAIVASGFMFRLIFGALAIHIGLTQWIIISVGSGAMILVVGKRRGELARKNDMQHARKVLASYSIPYLDGLLLTFSSVALVSYLLFCFSDYAQHRFSPFVALTAVPFILVIMRFLQKIMVFDSGEDPTQMIYHDHFLKIMLAIWALIFFILIY